MCSTLEGKQQSVRIDSVIVGNPAFRCYKGILHRDMTGSGTATITLLRYVVPKTLGYLEGCLRLSP